DEIPAYVDWTDLGLGITNAELASEEFPQAEDGSCLRASLVPKAGAQHFIIGVTDWDERLTYIRIWIANDTKGTVDVSIFLKNNDGAAVLAAADAEVYLADGTPFTCATRDASGRGNDIDSSVVIPSDFYGWIAFPIDKMIPHWTDPMIEGYPTTVNIDIRPVGFKAGDSYFVDGLTLTDSPTGVTGPLEKYPVDNIPSNIEKIEAALAEELLTAKDYLEIQALSPSGINPNVKAIAYPCRTSDGMTTVVFAYLGIPENANKNSPSIILLHGEDGHPSIEWITEWMDRGYVVLAPDIRGFFPLITEESGTAEPAPEETEEPAGETAEPYPEETAEPGGEETVEPYGEETAEPGAYGSDACDEIVWAREIPAILGVDTEKYVVMPDIDYMSESSIDVSGQWMFHALCATAGAASILRGLAFADPAKVGIAGVSWGGIVTSLYIGYDQELAFAIPIYGSGYLDEALTGVASSFEDVYTIALWSAAEKFNNVSFPVLWLCWNDDDYYTLKCNSMSYLATMGNDPRTRFSAVDSMMRGTEFAMARTEPYVFADSIVKDGAAPLPLFTELPSAGKHISCATEGAVKATLYYITEPLTYSEHEKYGLTGFFMDQIWNTCELSIDAEGNVTGTVPEDPRLYYVELTDADGNVVTSIVYD
ncbi:MAG: hypothetical protein J6112_01900, partial [Clostridia bacterium]|nr:hypothetical protein [Clostridia bacterium]